MKKSYIAIFAIVWIIFVAIGIKTVRPSLFTASKLTVPARKTEAVVRFVSNPQPAPPFLVKDIDGNVVSTASWPGKVVILNFWATWCSPCREEIPFLIKLTKKYKDGLLVVGVSLDEGSPGGVKEFAERFGISYPIVMGSAELIREYGGMPAVPKSFVVNKHGQIVQKHNGLLPPVMVENEIRALLGLPIDGKVETFEDTGQIFPKNPARATELPGVDFRKLTPKQKEPL
jgi:thiol-disulfide isomerase/thioredoxin